MKPTCQQTIADRMKDWVKDNPDGISSPTSERWDVSWKNIYGPSITGLKWYSV